MTTKLTLPLQELVIAGKTVSATSKPFVIAELACSHQGDVDEAVALVELASDAHADAIQFEIFNAHDNISPDFPNAGLIEKLQLSDEEWSTVFDCARSKNLPVVAYTYDMVSFELAKKLEPDAYKLNSSDLSHPDLLDGLARTGMPFTLGTGASDLTEIGESLNYVLERGGSQVVLMHGVQSFPTRIEDASINRLKLLKEKFGALVGYADHTDGSNKLAPFVDLIALGAGAVVLEKHICKFRHEDRIDSQSSLDGKEFATYVSNINAMWLAMGKLDTGPFTDVELKYRQFQKKTAVCKRAIAKHQVLQREDFVYLRHPQSGLSPMSAQKLIGVVASRDISPGQALQKSDFV